MRPEFRQKAFLASFIFRRNAVFKTLSAQECGIIDSAKYNDARMNTGILIFQTNVMKVEIII